VKDLLEKLRQEHQQILTMLDEKVSILEIIKFVEEVHHPREEQDLFPTISQNPLLSQGGPLCTYFRGLELDLNPNQDCHNYLLHLYDQGLPKPPPYKTFSWLNPQNPLSLPMDEHALGHEIAEALKHLTLPNCGPEFPDAFCKLSQYYEKLLRLHIAKEDQCLFVLCERFIS
jgi:hemerythrin-like domain-containing protein